MSIRGIGLIRLRTGVIGDPCECDIEPLDFKSHGVSFSPSFIVGLGGLGVTCYLKVLSTISPDETKLWIPRGSLKKNLKNRPGIEPGIQGSIGDYITTQPSSRT